MEKVVISKEEYENLKIENERLNQQNQWLIEQIRLSKHRQFGPSSEKSSPSQTNLFNEAEVSEKPHEPELVEVEKHYRKKSKERKDRLPSGLPVEVIEYTLPEDEQYCPQCESPLHIMGKKIRRRELKIIPAKAVIVEHVSYTYACRNCEKNGISTPVIKAPIPNAVIKGSFASPESVAHIMNQKFVMSSPLYRQEQEFSRQGILLSRQTMANWVIKCAESWLEPIYNELHKQLVAHEILHADETTVQILHEPDKSAQSKSYMWLYRTGSDAKTSIVLYDYQPDRSSGRPKDFLKGFGGFLHADGYEGYHNLEKTKGIIIIGCWAHARRKFEDALKSVPPKEQLGSNALIGKNYCDRLFSIERELAECISDERHQKRQELARPVLDEFFVWLDKHYRDGVMRNAFGKAVSYCLDQRKYLERYMLDGRLEISNNRAERSIRPFTIGRKNWLFSNTPRGAKSSAIIYSIIETAKENGLNPYDYLLFIFNNAPQWDIHNNPDKIRLLLPDAFFENR